MRAIGIDLGSKTVGISLSDTSRIIASPIGTFEIEENNLNEALKLVVDYIKKNNVSTIVLGLPKNMDGSIGFQGEYCLEFKKMLEDATKLEVVLIDERLTTVIAHKTLKEAKMKSQKRKTKVDKLAASIILQAYLDK